MIVILPPVTLLVSCLQLLRPFKTEPRPQSPAVSAVQRAKVLVSVGSRMEKIRVVGRLTS